MMLKERPLREGSLQANVVDFLKRNITESYTSQQIASEFDITLGTASGTLHALLKKGLVLKVGTNPVQFTYFSKEAESQNLVLSESLSQESADERTNSQSFLEAKVTDLKREIKTVEEKIRQLEEKKAVLTGKLEIVLEILAQNPSSLSL